MRWLVVVCVCLVGCAGGETTTPTVELTTTSTTEPTTTTTPAPTTTETTWSEEQQAILEVHDAVMTWFNDGLPSPDDPRIELFHPDTHEERRQRLASWAADGTIVVGQAVYVPVSVEVSGEGAEVTSCGWDRTELIGADGTVLVKADPTPLLKVDFYELLDGSWVNTGRDVEAEPCELS